MRRASHAVVVLLALAACGRSVQTDTLDVGTDDGGSPGIALTGDASGGGPLDVIIAEKHVAVTFVTLSCADGCADVLAVPSGGTPPYTFAWKDGPTAAARHVCPTSTTIYEVTVHDTATTCEVPHPAGMASASLTADVIACPDGGSAEGGLPLDAGIPQCGGPNTVCWAEWSSSTAGQPGSATATIATPQGPISVTYAGEVYQPLVASTVPNLFTPASTYTCATVTNPPNPTIVLQAGGTQLVDTLTFSRPVNNPLFAIMSLGNSTFNLDGEYDFGAYGEAFTILKYAMGSMAGPGTLTDVDGGLVGNDGDGLVQLIGTFTSIRWTDPVSELTGDHGFTIGVPAQ